MGNGNEVYGRVVKKNKVGSDYVEWTMDDSYGTKVWTGSSGDDYDRMDSAYLSKDDPRNPDKVHVKYTKKKISTRSGGTQEVNWVTSVSS